MAHGDHWSCVLTDDDADVTEYLSLATAKGNAVAGTAHCLEIKSAAEWKSLGVNPSSAPIAIVYDAGPYSILALMLYFKKRNTFFLMMITIRYGLHTHLCQMEKYLNLKLKTYLNGETA